MKIQTSLYNIKPVFRLWDCLNLSRKRQVKFLALLMVFVSFAEVLSIGAIVPFLAVFTDPEALFIMPEAQVFIDFFGIESSNQLLLPLTIIFVLAVTISGTMRIILLFVSTKISFALGADISFDIYRKTLYQPYLTHVSRNSSEVINGVAVKTNHVITNILIPVLNLIGSSVLALFILIALFYIDTYAAFFSIMFFSFIYILVASFTRSRLSNNSHHIARSSNQVIKSLQEGLGSIRDILIDGTQDEYCKVYRQADLRLRQSQASNLFISQSPRFGIESLGTSFIALLAFALTQESDGVQSAIPVLGAIALGAQRLLPLMQNIYLSWSNIQGGSKSLLDVLELLDQPIPKQKTGDACRMPFEGDLTLKNISFQYPGTPKATLSNINLIIKKGERVGIYGESGCGKSTLLDIMMGLLEPSEGSFEVDGVSITRLNSHCWRSKISHVPQEVFLTDDTIKRNIALGIDEKYIDDSRVWDAARKAQLATLIDRLPNGIDTRIGENGVFLSGGQRQRIGIARALYKEAQVIIFDEATSALDVDTESEVMSSIKNLNQDLTVVIVAHRLSTLQHCSQMLKLSNTRLT